MCATMSGWWTVSTAAKSRALNASSPLFISASRCAVRAALSVMVAMRPPCHAFHNPHPKQTRTACGIEKSPFSCDRSLIGSRRDAELLPERCDEVGWRRVPGSVRHVCDRQVWLTKEVHRSLTPPRHHKLMWRGPTHLAKRTDEVVRAYAGCRRKFSEGRRR